MNVASLAKALALTLAAALPLCALGSPPPTAISVDCAQLALPPQQTFAALAGIDNFDQAYQARARFMIRAQRACKRGADQVRISLQRPQYELLQDLAQAKRSR